ncbi:hypothetical protein EW145_g6984 [Phellinidium pouzarii]|uniref:Uncharacterized protein n=1 Tax=Phellinidium pouzarii TaxID=167371 RepID=A0A4S4KSU6_9AGAM|nr:hypothetical protein EW145_g6984 [Phellinidium pouzarii]
MTNDSDLGDDLNFFTSPRVAPTPPSLSFASPVSTSFSQESLLGSGSMTTPVPGPPPQSMQSTLPPDQRCRHSRLISSEVEPQTRTRTNVQELEKNTRSPYSATKGVGTPSTIASPASLSPEVVYKYTSAKQSGQSRSPEMKRVATPVPTSSDSNYIGLLPARPRPGHVRIGKEKVTLSVANVLEAELGVDVGDSDEESYYDDNHEEERGSIPFSKMLRNDKRNSSMAWRKNVSNIKCEPGHDSSDLPLLSAPSDELRSLGSNFAAGTRGGAELSAALKSESPLSEFALEMSASPTKSSSGVGINTGTGQCFRFPTVNENHSTRAVSHVTASCDRSAIKHSLTRSLSHSKSFNFPQGSASLGTQSYSVDRLDRISERSVLMQQESPQDDSDNKCRKESKKASPRETETRTEAKTETDSAITVQQLQRSLDVQCARFDRLAGQLLAIIQRHQNEKVIVENKISALEKEARRRDREIKGLRWLVARSNRRSSSQGNGGTRRPVRVASIQSFLSAAASDEEEEVDLSVAVEMLSRAGRDDASQVLGKDGDGDGDGDKDERTNVDLSTKASRKVKKIDLRRAKTMPDLHTAANGKKEGSGSGSGLGPDSEYTCTPSPPQQSPSPDISGLGLGLDFPLPEPLSLPSIASTFVTSSAGGSSAYVPALTTAPTAASGLSIATKRSVDSFADVHGAPSGPLPVKEQNAGVGRDVSAKEKRMAREWRAGVGPQARPGSGAPSQSLYRPAQPTASLPPSSGSRREGVAVTPASASVAYARNLNKGLAPSIDRLVRTEENLQSLDLDAIYQKLVASSSGLLD